MRRLIIISRAPLLSENSVPLLLVRRRVVDVVTPYPLFSTTAMVRGRTHRQPHRPKIGRRRNHRRQRATRRRRRRRRRRRPSHHRRQRHHHRSLSKHRSESRFYRSSSLYYEPNTTYVLELK